MVLTRQMADLSLRYSLHSRLIGEYVKARIYAEYIEVWYAQRRIEVLPRLRGENNHCINYRHIIDWLVRKPGAFENYRYKDDLFPTSQFRITYDLLRSQYGPKQANKQYLKILELAAKDSETVVNDVLRFLNNQADEINFEIVQRITADILSNILFKIVKGSLTSPPSLPKTPPAMIAVPKSFGCNIRLRNVGESMCSFS